MLKKSSFGIKGNISVEIIPEFSSREFNEEEKQYISQKLHEIFQGLENLIIKNDPEVIDKKSQWDKDVRLVFQKAEISSVYFQKIPSQYAPNDPYYPDWYRVTTPKGIITLGPRKRVYEIDYSELEGDKIPANDLFEKENVTASEFYVHAWSIDKLIEYLEIIYKNTK